MQAAGGSDLHHIITLLLIIIDIDYFIIDFSFILITLI